MTLRFLLGLAAIFSAEILYLQFTKSWANENLKALQDCVMLFICVAAYARFQCKKMGKYSEREIIFSACFETIKAVLICVIFLSIIAIISKIKNGSHISFDRLNFYPFLVVIFLSMAAMSFQTEILMNILVKILPNYMCIRIEKNKKTCIDKKSLFNFFLQFFKPFFVTLSLCLIVTFLVGLSGNAEWHFYNFSWDLFIYSFLYSMIAAVSEEILYRGLLLGALRTISPQKINLLIAAAFSIGGFIYMHTNKAHSASFFVILVFGTILLTILALKNNSLWAPIGVHCAWDFVQKITHGLQNNGMERLPGILKLEMGQEIYQTISLILLLIGAIFFVVKSESAFEQKNVTLMHQ